MKKLLIILLILSCFYSKGQDTTKVILLISDTSSIRISTFIILPVIDSAKYNPYNNISVDANKRWYTAPFWYSGYITNNGVFLDKNKSLIENTKIIWEYKPLDW